MERGPFASTPERIRELAREAANECYVTDTLKRAAGFTDGYSSTAALVGPLSPAEMPGG